MTSFQKRWRPSRTAILIAVPLATQLTLSGCAAGGMGDQLPHSMGGLPQGAPARPDKPHAYPGVYDTPAPRSTKPLDDTEQLRLQQDLQNLRDHQEKTAADPDAPPPATPGKKKGPSPKTGQATGAKANP